MNLLIEHPGTDPCQNLAIEEALLLKNLPVPAFFLWQNAHTVVIGCGQNAWKECRTDLLREEGGTLVRRSTGGGAVYHDLGNLNFSFVMPKALYDVGRQLNVIRAAAERFSIKTAASGRNDIVLEESGAKFSGNAFRLTQSTALHHGTILMDVDLAMMGRYLAPSKEKLQAKGVESVRARVGNLSDYARDITVPALKEALFDAFEQEYGPARHTAWEDLLDQSLVNTLAEKYRSWEWTYGKTPRFDLTLYQRCPWGQAELLISCKSGHIQEAQCYTDANDAGLSSRVSRTLTGVLFTPQAMSDKLLDSGITEDADIAAWLLTQRL